MLLHVPFVFVTGEYFFTGIVLSFLVCIFCLGYLARSFQKRGVGWKMPVFVLALLTSKAAFDYTSSGLENPLSYLLVAVAVAPWLASGQSSRCDENELRRTLFLGSLAYVNRQDTLLLLAPMMAYALLRASGMSWKSRMVTVLWCTSPAWLWTLFSLWYYGFPFPNTYYAKAGDTGVPFGDRLSVGFDYLSCSVIRDLPSAVYLLAATLFVLVARAQRAALALAGVWLYLLYVVLLAGSATHMTHRFVAVPAFVAMLVLVEAIRSRRQAIGWAIASLLVLAVAANSPLRIRSASYSTKNSPNAIDTKWFVHNEGAALLDNLPVSSPTPKHAWYVAGLRLRARPEGVRWGGDPGAFAAMGYFGMAASPGNFIVDPVGLCDPLLARLPADPRAQWQAGHYARRAPEGYLGSLADEKLRIADEDLRSYNEELRCLTRGSLYSLGRLLRVARFNLGVHDDLLESYARRVRSPE